MKILITGFNKNQCTRKFYLRQQLKVIPSHYSLFNCLVDMGHTVEQRQVTLGEDLSSYDEVIVFIAGPRQLVATTVFEGLYAIGSRPDAILAFDDWQVPDLFKGVQNAAKDRELYAQFILDVNKKTMAELEPYEQHFSHGLEVILAKKNRMLISAFRTEHLNDPENYGPHLLFDKIEYPRERLFVYNPNPYHRNRTWEAPWHTEIEGLEAEVEMSFDNPRPPKEQRFNFASLVQSKTQKWLKKQGYTGNPKDEEQGFIRHEKVEVSEWPVDLYGSKADTQKRLTEDEMVKVITRDWGCLMPGYSHAGSGWWRARPLQCAQANSILIGDEKEMRVYYGAEYPYYGLKASDLIDCPIDELEAIAAAQTECIMNVHPLDKMVQRNELMQVLTAEKVSA